MPASAPARHIQRSDFDLDGRLDLVGDEVRIEIEIESIEQRR